MAGNTFKFIASKRGIKEATVINYILDVVREGGPYDFRQFLFTKVNRNLIVSAHIDHYFHCSHHAIVAAPGINNSNNNATDNEVDRAIVATTNPSAKHNIDTIISVSDIQKVFQKYNFSTVPCYWHIKMIQMHLERNLGANWLLNLVDIEKKCGRDANSCNSSVLLPTTPLALGAVIDREFIDDFLS